MMNNKVLCYLAFGMASALSIVGLWMPPMGVVDASVIFLVAQFLLLVASLCGVDAVFLKYYNTISKIKK